MVFRYLQYIITWCKQRRASSSLTRRILAINLLVLIVPVGGFFFLESYQKRLIESEIESLKVQAEIFAGAVGALATKTSPILGHQIIPIRANIMLHRLTSITNTRVRLYGSNGTLMADTQLFPISRGAVLIDELPPPDSEIGPGRWFVNQINKFLNWIPGQNKLPLYIEANPSNAENFKEVKVALFGEQAAAVRRHEPNGLIISVALPVQHYRQVIGALMVSNNGHKIEQAMRAIRLDILKVFTIALIITILLSLYLAGTIARPINRLAAAAEKVRTGHGRHVYIPDFTSRRDEIGELSRDLRGMTEALWQRMDAIEKFAADVSHEIKNPLTSLRSAVETVARISDIEKQKKLMAIILDDVQRLDRLISDISDASRLDAELSRDVPAPVNLRQLLEALTEIEKDTALNLKLSIYLFLEEETDLIVSASEGRLGQVFLNIINNAISFSPPHTKIIIRAERRIKENGSFIRVSIEDEGPGIPEDKLASIFDRFYTDRSVNAKKDDSILLTHSGLGLSISKQIVEAADGHIWAENCYKNNLISGAIFIVELPAN
ncbi:MAG: histidine kinase [Rhodospirillaceae bacterium]|nr:histidine kinase [Rhodospirillaceae bacterium]